jgi:hypothetical protein
MIEEFKNELINDDILIQEFIEVLDLETGKRVKDLIEKIGNLSASHKSNLKKVRDEFKPVF